MAYSTHFGNRTSNSTPQTRKAIGKDQVKNSAGGYVFEAGDWDRLCRFCILGSEGGSYYVGERKLTIDNANCVLRCLKEDGVRAVNLIVNISEQGRAVKNEPALFALAIACASEDEKTKKAALAALPKVARIGTHLFQFAQYVSAQRGWGPSLRKAFAAWYNEKDASRLAYQVIKYPQRTTEEGLSKSKWSHRDILRKSHPVGDAKHNRIYDYVTSGKLPSRLPKDLAILRAAEAMKVASSAREVCDLIETYSAKDINLPHELIPKQFASDKGVWEVQLPSMPLTATLRMLGRLTSYGLLSSKGSSHVSDVLNRLTDEEYIRKSRVHPLSVLVAMKTYRKGSGVRGNMSWTPNQKIVDALDSMFYLSFGNVVPTNKRIMLALDVSGSMNWCSVSGIDGLTPMEASAVMAMVTARVEKDYEFMGFSHNLVPLAISPRQRMDEVLKVMNNCPMGGTNCSLPMVYATKNRLDFDAFCIYTDNETYRGGIHPFEALKNYRMQQVEDAKLAVIATTSTEFSIADKDDAGSLDCVGFDVATPNIISGFISGSLIED